MNVNASGVSALVSRDRGELDGNVAADRMNAASARVSASGQGRGTSAALLSMVLYFA